MKVRDLLIITLASLYFFIFGNWVLSITSLDEGRNLDATLRMLEGGNFLVPFYNCDYRFEKPPLLYWLTSISFFIFGVSEFSARLVSGLSAFLTALLTYKIAYDFFDREKALYSALIFSTLVHLWVESRAAVPEMLLTGMMTLSLYLFLKERFTLGWFFVALAFLTKGPVGVVLPTAVYLLWKRRLDFINVKGLILFILVGFSWYFLMLINFGYEYFYKFFIYENLVRYTGAVNLHPRPIYFYPLVVLASAMLYLPLVLKLLYRRYTSPLLLWFGFVLLFFSLSQNRLHHYILFLYPPLAIMLSQVAGRRYMQVSMPLAFLLVGLIYFKAESFERERFVPKAVQRLKETQEEVYFYKYENSAVVFYTRKCIDRKEGFTAGDLIITSEKRLGELSNYEVLTCGREFEGKVCLVRKL